MALSKQVINDITAALEMAREGADAHGLYEEEARYQAALDAINQPAGVERTSLGLSHFLVFTELQVNSAVARLEASISESESKAACIVCGTDELKNEIAVARSVVAALKSSGSMMEFLGDLTHDEMVLLKDLL